METVLRFIGEFEIERMRLSNVVVVGFRYIAFCILFYSFLKLLSKARSLAHRNPNKKAVLKL